MLRSGDWGLGTMAASHPTGGFAGWYYEVQATLVAARAAVLAAIAFAVVVAIPDQSTEAARIMLTWHWAWATLGMAAWFAFCLSLGVTLAGAAWRALRLSTVASAPTIAKNVVLVLLATPFLAAFVAFDPVDLALGGGGSSTGQNPIVRYGAALTFIAFAVLPAIIAAEYLLDQALGARLRNRPHRVRDGVLHAFQPAIAIGGGRAVTWGFAILFGGWALLVEPLEQAFGLPLELPALLFLALGATAVVALLETLAQFAERRRWPLLALVIAVGGLWSYADLNDNHTLRTQPRPADAAAPPPMDAAFAAWLDARAGDRAVWAARGEPYPVLLVAAEGGGARAAAFTALVLEELGQRCPALLRHTFLIAGVSGGSVGAALVAAGAARSPPPSRVGCGGDGGLPGPATQALRADLLAPLVRGATVFDVAAQLLPTDLGRVLPFAAWRDAWDTAIRGPLTEATDRARYLERALDRAWWRQTGESLDRLPFQALWPGPGGDIPALLLLTTDVASGRRVAVSHLAMPGPPAPNAGECAAPPTMAPPAELARLRTLAEWLPGRDVSVATAAILSARFPVLTPAATLPCPGAKRRLVDGGYFENSGLTTVLDVVDALRDGARVAGAALIVLRIENSRATPDGRSARGAPAADPTEAFAELGSPIRALLATRGARGEQARAAMARAVREAGESCDMARSMRAAGAGDPGCVPVEEIVVALHPACVPIPLGWALSDAARDELRRQFRGEAMPGGCGVEDPAGLAANRHAVDRVRALLTR